MLIRRIFDDRLAQAAYLVVDRGEAVVIDPNRDVGVYAEAATRDNARIVAVTETHIHADFVSGARELARRTGAQLYLSDEGGADWRYAYAADARAKLLKNGDTIRVGRARLQALHTPGHTPEHLTFLLTDTAASDQPMGAFTGDFIFVGDVGRPDLLEKAAKQQGTAESGARTLFRSVRRFLEMPDWLQLWPGHGAGSSCGKGIGAMPQSTIGYEKIANAALGITDEDQFVRAVLEGLTDPPPYFAHMKRTNREGPAQLSGRDRPPRLAGEAVEAAIRNGALVVDTRPLKDFADGHLPGTISVPLDRSFLTWAGWLIPVEREFYLIVDSRTGGGIDEAVRDLAKIGIERIAGWTGATVLDAHHSRGSLQRIPELNTADLHELIARGEVNVIDVRNPSEWMAGHVANVPNIPLGQLTARLSEVPKGKPLAVHCQGGHRSIIASSILQAAGIADVHNVTGGFADWERREFPVEREVRREGQKQA